MTTRRDFLASSTLAAASTFASGAYAGGGDTLRIALIGCGGRGTGAAANALNADPNVKLVALGDMFADRLEGSLKELQSDSAIAGKIDVPPERRFTGFDAYKQAIDCGIDVALLTTPPGFRPQHLKYAIEQGKHVFCEKPMAVDPAGVRSIIETAKLAKEKNLTLVGGFCYRYDPPKREVMKRIHGGQIGDVVTVQTNYLAGTLWHKNRDPKWDEMTYQLRNWYYYTWLSGDHIVEQHCHSLDKALWAFKDATPVAAVGLGGRAQRNDARFGHIFDHHAVIFEFADGRKIFSFCRQQKDTFSDVSDYVFGTKGQAELQKHVITGEQPWKFKGNADSMYQVEHNELFAAVRAGKPINDGEQMARSTLMAVLGRTATYTGKRVTWQQMLSSQENLTPPTLAFGPTPVPTIAVPGVTKVV